MITTFIENIKAIEIESAISVCKSIIEMIDKHETVQEYANNEDLPDIIMESMLWFMESKNRERDKTPRNEIAQWMEKKGYWYQGDNTKKKKECNRMYHFLQQHKFDPKTETYEPDIDDGKGSKKRIKLIIDPKISKEDKDFYLRYKDAMMNNTAEWKRLPHETRSKVLRIYNTISFFNNIEQGGNAAYTNVDQSIKIGAKELKGKQIYSQFTIKHEEGHADSHHHKGGSGFFNEELPNDHPANIALKQHKNAGKYVSEHDDSTEELMADLYAALHGQKRTKNWGKARETQSLTRSDISRIFNKWLLPVESCIRVEKICITNMQNDYIRPIETIINHITSDKYLATICDLGDEEFLDEINTFIENFDISERLPSLSNHTYDKKTFDNASRDAKKYRKEVQNLQTLLENVIEVYKSYGIKNKEILKRFSLMYFDKKTAENLEYVFDLSENLFDIITYIDKDIDFYNKLMTSSNKLKSRIDIHKIGLSNILLDVKREYKKSNSVSVKTRYKLKNNIIKTVCGPNNKHYTELKKLSEDFDKCQRETNSLRIKFAQSVIKEYFTGLFLMNGYFYYD